MDAQTNRWRSSLIPIFAPSLSIRNSGQLMAGGNLICASRARSSAGTASTNFDDRNSRDSQNVTGFVECRTTEPIMTLSKRSYMRPDATEKTWTRPSSLLVAVQLPTSYAERSGRAWGCIALMVTFVAPMRAVRSSSRVTE